MSVGKTPGCDPPDPVSPARISITGIAATRFNLPLRASFHPARGAVTSRRGLILRVATDSGVVGIGEASPHPALGPGALSDVERTLERIAEDIIGTTLTGVIEDPARGRALSSTRSGLDPEGYPSIDEWIEALRGDVPPALACGLEVAVTDALARLQNVELARLLGGPVHSSVPVNATIGARAPAEIASQAAAARANGFSCVKLKVGTGASVEEERERVAAARQALGPDVSLRLDANGAWSEADAVSFIHALQGYGLDFIEQPIRPGNPEGMRRLQQAVTISLAADEDITSLDAARGILELQAARVLVVKPLVVGGLRTVRRIADLARAGGVLTVVTTTVDSGIGTAAALQLAASLPETTLPFGLATAELLEGDLIESPIEIRDGRMQLPPGPGLGVTLDEDELERFAEGPSRSWHAQ